MTKFIPILKTSDTNIPINDGNLIFDITENKSISVDYNGVRNKIENKDMNSIIEEHIDNDTDAHGIDDIKLDLTELERKMENLDIEINWETL
jgi:hypothetical protein